MVSGVRVRVRLVVAVGCQWASALTNQTTAKLLCVETS